MNRIKKTAFAIFGAIALALVPINGAKAAFGFITDAATVDDVTTTACTTASGQSVEGFGNGVSMDQVWDLEREIGSPGSGAWETVANFTDVFPTANGGVAVGGVTQIFRTSSPSPNGDCYRLFMRTDAGGTAQIQLITNRGTPLGAQARSTHMTFFDDFNGSVLQVAALGFAIDYLSFVGTAGQNNVVGVGEVSPEGILTMSGGDTGNAEDTVEVTAGTAGYGGLVSAGAIIVEYRVSVEDITAGDWIVGLTEDVTADGSEDMEYDVNTNVIVDASTVANSIAFAFSSDAVAPTLLQAVSTNGANIGNAADEYSLGNAPVAATYQRLRIEIDTNGDAYWFVDGVLMGAESLAVATTATLMPYMAASSADDCGASCGATKLDIDYLLWIVPRPDTT